VGKSGKILIIVGSVLVLILLIYYFGLEEKEETYTSDSWIKTYDPQDKGPYGTYVLKELLDTTGLFGEFLQLNAPLEETLEDDSLINDIYFFVGHQNYMSDTTSNFLMDFVEKGNTALIATSEFPEKLINLLCHFNDPIFGESDYTKSQSFKFLHPELSSKRYQFDYIYNNKKDVHTWNFFDTSAFIKSDHRKLIPLGTSSKNQVNFIRIEYGEGQLILHSIPYAFTNVSLMKNDGFMYVENVLKHVPPGRVQWDKYNLDYHWGDGNGSGDSDGDGGGEERVSKIQFILDNPPLLWAFIILLVGALLYALFKGKRMQKIIPAVESKKNLSLEYINTLSSLYLQEKKHQKLVHLKQKTFLNYIAERYYMHTNKPDMKFIAKLANKSSVPESLIIDIFKTFDELEHTIDVTDDQLINLHQKIETFLKNCR
jgi:hypothetical protein